MYRILLVNLICLAVNQSMLAQTILTDYVQIPPTVDLTKVVKAKYSDTLTVGSVVKREMEREIGGKKYLVTVWDTIEPGEETKYQYEKSESINMGYIDGRATLTISEDKKSANVNFWLIEEAKIAKGQDYKVLKRTITEKTKFDKKMFDSIPLSHAKKDSSIRLNIVSVNSVNIIQQNWFQKSDIIIAVYSGDTINRYLANKYDRDGDYKINLENRDFFSSWRIKQILGPVTIPLKYRPGYSVGDSINVRNDFGADANVGIFWGGSIGKYRVRYEKDYFNVLPEFGLVCGGFLNLSAVELDSLSTTAGKVPFKVDEKARIGVLSAGFGLMFGVNNFNIGGFVGWDFGFGSDAKNWNFNNRMWLGLGISYSPTLFWKK